jgi:hypothetical protein
MENEYQAALTTYRKVLSISLILTLVIVPAQNQALACKPWHNPKGTPLAKIEDRGTPKHPGSYCTTPAARGDLVPTVHTGQAERSRLIL